MTAWRLAIDAAGGVASVAVGRPGAPAAGAITLDGARRHASELPALVDRALRQAGARLADVGEIVLADGPGSFTGLRVAWALGKGLAHDRGLPLFAVPSLMGLARSAAVATKAGDRAVAACFDALRGEVFVAVYAFSGDPRAPAVRTVVPPALTTIAALAGLAADPPAVFVGDGAERYAAELERLFGRRPYRPGTDSPPVAASLLWLRDARGGARAVGDSASEPAYGRPAEAQVRWEARHGRPLPDPRRAGD